MHRRCTVKDCTCAVYGVRSKWPVIRVDCVSCPDITGKLKKATKLILSFFQPTKEARDAHFMLAHFVLTSFSTNFHMGARGLPTCRSAKVLACHRNLRRLVSSQWIGGGVRKTLLWKRGHELLTQSLGLKLNPRMSPPFLHLISKEPSSTSIHQRLGKFPQTTLTRCEAFCPEGR